MRLWTIQPEEVYEKLLEEKTFRCEKELSENLTDVGCQDFMKAYDWLVQQMDKKGIEHPEGVTYPVWAWHTRKWKHTKPDLRYSDYGRRGEHLVCMELEIPDDQVLLSDFERWHDVLNNWYSDASTNEEEWEKEHEWYDNLPEEQKKEELLKSWERIFDLTPIDTDWRANGRYIQAVFWELKLENIIDVRHFVCK